MSKKAFITVALVAFTATAQATNWVILMGTTHRCVSAKALAADKGIPALASPLAARNVLRTLPGWKGTKVIPLKGKLGRMVILEGSGDDLYFSALAGCQMFLRRAIANGRMVPLSALR